MVAAPSASAQTPRRVTSVSALTPSGRLEATTPKRNAITPRVTNAERPWPRACRSIGISCRHLDRVRMTGPRFLLRLYADGFRVIASAGCRGPQQRATVSGGERREERRDERRGLRPSRASAG